MAERKSETAKAAEKSEKATDKAAREADKAGEKAAEKTELEADSSALAKGLAVARADVAQGGLTAQGRARLTTRAAPEPDHADVEKTREEREKRAESDRARRKKMRANVDSGHIPGKWVSVGGRLVNLDRLSSIDLPTEGDDSSALVFTTSTGERIAVTGEESAEIMNELGLSALPKDRVSTDNRGDVNEQGRIVTPADTRAEAIPGRTDTSPNHPHRANAVLTDGETDYDVFKRAGNMPVPPAVVPTTPLPPVSPAVTLEEGAEGEEGDKGETGETADESEKGGKGKTVRGTVKKR